MTTAVLQREGSAHERPTSSRRRSAPPPAAVAAVVLVTCLMVAAASVVALPTVPLYDEFSWLVWGRELAHHVIGAHEPFVLAGGSSWKPLPVLFAAVVSLFGSAAVTLWLLLVRTVGLLALWPAYRLGSRLGASERWPAAGPVGGVFAAIAVMLTSGWCGFMLGATSEPLGITATLLCVDAALSRRRVGALTAGVALALIRPEAAVLVAVYGLWCLWQWRSLPGRLLIVCELLLVPAAWLAPPWIAEGSPLQAATEAQRGSTVNAGHDLATIALTRAEHMVVTPVLIAAVLLVAWALWRRERAVVALALVSAAYVVVVELMTLRGFPGLNRYMLPAAAIVSVLAGAAVARCAALAGGGVASAAAVVVLLALGAPGCVSAVSQVSADRHAAATALRGHESLVSAVTRAGGPRKVLPCASSAAAVNWREATQLAWILHVPLSRIDPTPDEDALHRPGLAFLSPGGPALGRVPPLESPRLREHRLWHDGVWEVTRIVRSGDSSADRCVGD